MLKQELLIPIRYVGLSESGYADHLYDSGGVWPMQDSVKDVPLTKAIKLLDHPEFEDAREDTSVPLKMLLAAEHAPKPELEDEDRLQQEAPLVDLSTLTKAQLKEYAHRNFGIELPDTDKKDVMINTVRLRMGKAPA